LAGNPASTEIFGKDDEPRIKADCGKPHSLCRVDPPKAFHIAPGEIQRLRPGPFTLPRNCFIRTGWPVGKALSKLTEDR
jgi:hypothetical protein